jgi:hypothetical protein
MMQQISSYHNQWTPRIPLCNILRPSTLKGSSSNAAIQVSHEFQLQVIHETRTAATEDDRKPLVYSLRWPVTLASCMCRQETLRLPVYSKHAPVLSTEHAMNPVDLATGAMGRKALPFDCVCTLPEHPRQIDFKEDLHSQRQPQSIPIKV